MKKRTKLLAAILSACMMVIPVSAQEYSYRGSAASTTDAREFTLGQLGQSDGIMTLSGDSDDSTVSFNENEYGVLYCTNKLRMQYGLLNYKKPHRSEVLNCQHLILIPDRMAVIVFPF